MRTASVHHSNKNHEFTAYWICAVKHTFFRRTGPSGTDCT